MLAAIEFGVTVVEYTPAEIKRAVVGYGRAEKAQVGQMVKLLLGLDAIPKPHDAADALAVAICHLHNGGTSHARLQSRLYAKAIGNETAPKRWRDYRPSTRNGSR
jgi:crossover junction endodeoxyribonuclease RuvC